jgi:hypothetical protein
VGFVHTSWQLCHHDPSEARTSSRQSLDDGRFATTSWRQSRHDRFEVLKWLKENGCPYNEWAWVYATSGPTLFVFSKVLSNIEMDKN